MNASKIIAGVVVAIAPQGQYSPDLAVEFIHRALLLHDLVVGGQAPRKGHFQRSLTDLLVRLQQLPVGWEADVR